MPKSLKLIYVLSIFLFIYIFPLVINFIQVGPNLSGNAYQLEISYIQTTNQLFNHFLGNLTTYFNLFSNPIFWFFISAVVAQKTMRWILEDD